MDYVTLVVCAGNICRSPVAAALLRTATSGSPIKVYSAGLIAPIGQPPHPYATAFMHSLGIDLSDHRATKLNSIMVARSNLVLVMDTRQKRAIEKASPNSRGKVMRLGEFVNSDVPDPVSFDSDQFNAVMHTVSEMCRQWANWLLKEQAKV